MQLGRDSALAVLAAAQLARTGGEVEDLAAILDVPENDLRRVLGRMEMAGIVESYGQGHRLKQDPAKVALLEVVQAVESDLREEPSLLRDYLGRITILDVSED